MNLPACRDDGEVVYAWVGGGCWAVVGVMVLLLGEGLYKPVVCEWRKRLLVDTIDNKVLFGFFAVYLTLSTFLG